MNFDLSGLPNSIDLLHLGLGGLALIQSILLVILLCIIVIGLVRKPKAPIQPAATPVQQPVATPPVKSRQPETTKTATPSVTLKQATPDAALQLLGLLQQEARFIDFIEEDIASYSDSDIGAAARVVHEGCHKVLHNHFSLKPIENKSENSRITIQSGFDPSAVRLTGNIVGDAPFTGTLVHRGWRVTDIRLPKLAEGHDVNIVAAAEVEL